MNSDFQSLEKRALALLKKYGEEAFTEHLSASQHDTFVDCERKWGYRKLDGHEGEENGYAKAGRAIHGVLEEYLTSGQLPDPDAEIVTFTHPKTGEEITYTGQDVTSIILPGIPYLPAPGEGKVEGEFELNTMVGVWLGYKDLVHGSRVIDHKTTGNFAYAKTEDELKTNAQAVLYAADEMDRDETLTEVQLCWIYYLRNPNRPNAKAVETKLTCQEVDRNILPVLEVGLQIQERYLQAKHEGLTADGLPYNLETCSKYGGCPYSGNVCQIPDTERMKGLMANLSMRERMKARLAQKAVQKAEAPAEAELPKVNPPARATRTQVNKEESGAAKAPGTVAAVAAQADPQFKKALVAGLKAFLAELE